MTAYRAGPIKRNRRTRAQVEQLDRQILDVLQFDHPQSVRHVFYRLTDPRLPEPVEKSDSGYRHVQERCVRMRRSGRLPYGWITDATRRGYFTVTYNDAGDFLRRVAGLYRADLWASADFHCEVWVESRSIAGVVQDVCEDLAVSLYPAGGFSSLTLAFEAAQLLNFATRDGRPAVVLYIGDYDPAGVLIDVSLERELRKHLAPETAMEFRRIAITRAQIDNYDLPTKPRKAQEKRAPAVAATVEAEAMPANVLRELLRNEIEGMLRPGAIEIARAAEESEREQLRRIGRMVG